MKPKQKIISEALGISDSLLSMIKSGERGITYSRAKELEKLTGIDVDFWITSKPEDRWAQIEKYFTRPHQSA